jgi:hypothetical protein
MVAGVVVTACLVVAAAAVILRAQQSFEFYLFAIDKQGVPVLDVKDTEILMKEGGKEGHVLGVRRYGWPLKVTILLDNGVKTNSMLLHVRNGLRKFVDGIPPEVPVTLITTAPSPRFLVRESKDPVQLHKAVSLVVAESEEEGSYGRFSDSLIEYAHRLDDEFRRVSAEQKPPYLPVLIVISTTMQDGSFVRREDNERMILSLRKHRVWTNFVMITPNKPPSFGADLNPDDLIDNAQIAELAKIVQEATGGRYFPVGGAGASALSTLLMPNLAQDVVLRYLKQMTQHRVIAERADGATGPIRNLFVTVNRPGVQVVGLSLDGSMP